MVLENPLRRLIQNPYQVLREMGVTTGVKLLDIGCGSGYISIPAAEKVGPVGHVYSIDNDEAMLEILRRRAERRGLKNLTSIAAEAWRIDQIQPSTIDVALMLFSLHHFAKPRESIAESFTKLKRGGRLYIYEPIKTRFAGHGTQAENVADWAANEGFTIKSLKKGLLTYRLELLKP